jgi:hypothetical protein
VSGTWTGSPLKVSTAAADGCATASTSAGFSWATVLIVTTVGLVLWWITQRARMAPAHPNPVVRRIGGMLQRFATLSLIGGAVSYAVGLTQRDRCGQLTGLGIDLSMWLLLASAVLLTFGLAMTTTSEWAAILAVATLDLGLATLMAVVSPTSHRRQLITLLVVHGICTAVAGWWSWRVHRGTPLVRARGSEAGRTLAAGWIVVVVLAIGLSDEQASVRGSADTYFLALFVVTAISIVMGAGYTKYVEARESLAPDEHSTFTRTWRQARTFADWSTRYSEWC